MLNLLFSGSSHNQKNNNIFLDLYTIIIITYTYVFYFIPNLHSIQIHTEELYDL